MASIFLTSRPHPEDMKDDAAKIGLGAKKDISTYIIRKIDENPRQDV